MMRAKRNALPIAMRMQAAHAIARRLFDRKILRARLHIGVYAAFDGEIDLTTLMRRARRAQCVIYAPRITNWRARRMEFIELPRNRMIGDFRRNRSEILEPRSNLHRSID